jgi:hypothetical protein
MIVLPGAVWGRLLDELARHVEGVELVAYLDGVREGDLGVVTTLVLPDAELAPGYFTVPTAAMSQAGQHFRQHGLARLLQIHTHGGAGCAHSWRDDEMAYSQQPGALSLVLPFHARRRPGPFDGLLHVREISGWRPLDDDEARSLLRVVPAHLDFRSERWMKLPPATEELSRAGFGRWISRWRRRSSS